MINSYSCLANCYSPRREETEGEEYLRQQQGGNEMKSCKIIIILSALVFVFILFQIRVARA